ncbi:unnamed protein product [Adineta ricciae]|uniref:Uncharacterized protein n=1 Tax=Adineta ricciae TaxID=249248 RepID=A0A814W9Z8_ADIRI|nr:unnamed protein product [Adineta ricciae]CAF1314108.1 unnamed protein product [Adineta ricciae]
MEAFMNAGVIPIPSKMDEEKNLHAAISAIANDLAPSFTELESETEIEDKRLINALRQMAPYPTLVELQSTIVKQNANEATTTMEPPSIERLQLFLAQRTTTIKELKKLRASMSKHIRNCKISNTFGNSASVVGGTLCFFFPTIGVPLVLAGSATSLGTAIAGSMIEKRLQKKYTHLLNEDSLAMQMCETNLKDITTWLITVYSFGQSVTRAGVDLFQLADSIQAASTLTAWSEIIAQLPSLSNALATGAKTISTVSGQILGISVIISVADLIHTWISKNATLESIDKDIVLLEQQLNELKHIAAVYPV